MTAVMPTYGRVDVAFEKGEGPYLFDTDGRRFLDFCGGIAVDVLGHAHPHLVATLQEQSAKLWHVSNLYRIPGQERLAERLAATSFADLTFFCNSGAEAVEGGLKLCRKYHSANGEPEKWRFITCGGAFHGRTLATISAANNEKHLAGFGPRTDGFDNVAFGDLNELRAAVTGETAAILLEPIQGEGGIRPADLDYLRGVREVADEFGLLLFFDEVQCGIGRTGRLWAHEWAGIEPDVMAIAKGLGGGFPVGAFLATAEAAKGMVPGTHGSTFGGNPLAMAVANAVMDVILEDGFLAHVEKVGAYLAERLEDLVRRRGAVFTGTRGNGLMQGLICGPDCGAVGTRLFEEGLLTVIAGENVVRLLPPLIIETAHVDEAVAILDRVAEAWPAGES
ncbi:MAG: aspartate aminotransferase family protein [Alphaproteobacteria bacterium]|nr:aspartate aminotransferase family protein [Alphaproteobacteria bacterium]